jgi:glycosyltransferase involved in cell wall biosynthesis
MAGGAAMTDAATGPDGASTTRRVTGPGGAARTDAAGGTGVALRVAFVAGIAAGGTGAHVAALARGCREAGLTVSVLAPPGTLRLLTSGSAAPGPAVPLRMGTGPRPDRDGATVARLRGWLAAWQPDVVHAHGVRAGALSAIAIALLRRAARPCLVVTVHNAPPDGHVAAAVHGQLERVCARRADLVLCASVDLLARLRARGAADAEQFDVPAAPAAPPTAAAIAAVRREFSADGRPIVLAAGRLAPQKGLDVLIDAAARWRDRDPRPVTVIAGAGPLAAALGAQAAGLAAGDVRLIGPRSDVPALLGAADVVVVPSRWEARALIVQEAMRAGRPVIATRVGGIPDLVGAGALLVPPGDPAALAAAVTAVLDQPALAARLGRSASAQATSFPSAADALAATLARYARLAARRSRAH